jgi:hypothetical protein
MPCANLPMPTSLTSKRSRTICRARSREDS